MRGFITIPLFLIALFALAMGAAMQIGRNQPFPERVTRLHLTDCSLPCWNDITQGVTPLTEVKTRIDASLPDFEGSAAVPGDKFLTWTEVDNIDRIVGVVDVTFTNDLAATVGIGTDHTSTEMPSLREILTVYGSPTCVMLTDEAGDSTWFYENAAHHFMLQFSVRLLALTNTVNNFVFGAPDDSTCHNAGALSWHDFRRAEPGFLGIS